MDAEVSTLARIYENVHLGVGARIGDFVILGHPPANRNPGELPLQIGEGALIRSHSVIYSATTIGRSFQAGHGVLVREHCTIGDRCSVGSGSIVEFKVRIGNDVRLHSRVFVPEYSILEDGCWLGPGVIVTNARYPAAKRTKETLEGVTIRAKAKVGANVTILPGVTIGEGALVGAGSVVVRDVPSWSITYGTPARVVGDVRELTYRDTGTNVYSELS